MVKPRNVQTIIKDGTQPTSCEEWGGGRGGEGVGRRGLRSSFLSIPLNHWFKSALMLSTYAVPNFA